MLSDKRSSRGRRHGRTAYGLLLGFALSACGCSADVTRFQSPAFDFADNSRSTGSLPVPPEPIHRHSQSYDGPPRGVGFTTEAGRPYTSPPSYGSPAGTRIASHDLTPVPSASHGGPLPPPADRAPIRPSFTDRRPGAMSAGGEAIEVQQGDTLYGLAKRYSVPISALIEANGLQQGGTIKPGQRLVVPSGGRPARSLAEAPQRTPVARATVPVSTSPSEPASPGWDGRYTLRHGDSLYAIARHHRVTLTELQRANGITDPTKVRAGTVLHVPGAGESPAERSHSPGVPPTVASLPTGQRPDPPRVINAPAAEPTRVAARDDTATDAGPQVTEAAAAKFRWPVKGRIIASFGKRPDGTHNDGINLAVPQGTEVHAVESGRVAYAGNELKGYGNLILIRHENGWVSAYAHNDEVLVKRDDVVRRGQLIARAGRTGSVDQPQLHFELRQGSRPVDPLPHLEKN